MGPTRVLTKDGGFGTQMTVHVGNAVDGDPLWSARFNATNPAAVINTHLDFLQSFPLILASIGPYGAHLHDGSEYTGAYVDDVPLKEITDWHRIRIDACIAAGVDALAIETIPCQAEAEALVEMLCDDYPEVKFWISYQCKDESTLAHGENFADVARSLWELLGERNARSKCLAIGVNCVHPKFVTPLFKSLNGNTPDAEKIPLVAYPNSGEVYDVAKGWQGREHCVPLASYVSEWSKLGAKIIGGCCRTYARDVRLISESVKEHNNLNRLI